MGVEHTPLSCGVVSRNQITTSFSVVQAEPKPICLLNFISWSGDDGVYQSGVDLVGTISLSETDLINLIGMTDEHQNAEFYMNEKTFLAEVYPLSKTGTLVSKENGKWFISDKEVNFSSKVQDGIIYLANMDYMGINVFRPSKTSLLELEAWESLGSSIMLQSRAKKHSQSL